MSGGRIRFKGLCPFILSSSKGAFPLVDGLQSYTGRPPNRRMAIRITRVYTRTGDKGTTALVGGTRVPKDAPRITAYGTIDELNSAIGVARVFNDESVPPGARARLEEVLKGLQNELFDLGSELATPSAAAYEGMFRVGAEAIERLEALMDECQADLEPLNSFILPGGGRVSAFLHVARTVCRRAEREVLALSRVEDIGPYVLPYVNRLSDLLFVLSRWVGKQCGEPEYLWERGLRAHARGVQPRRKKGT